MVYFTLATSGAREGEIVCVASCAWTWRGRKRVTVVGFEGVVGGGGGMGGGRSLVGVGRFVVEGWVQEGGLCDVVEGLGILVVCDLEGKGVYCCGLIA